MFKLNEKWVDRAQFEEFQKREKVLFNSGLAIINYVDDTDERWVYKTPECVALKEYRDMDPKKETAEFLMKKSKEVLDGVYRLVDQIGREKFSIEDDGSVYYEMHIKPAARKTGSTQYKSNLVGFITVDKATNTASLKIEQE